MEKYGESRLRERGERKREREREKEKNTIQKTRGVMDTWKGAIKAHSIGVGNPARSIGE